MRRNGSNYRLIINRLQQLSLNSQRLQPCTVPITLCRLPIDQASEHENHGRDEESVVPEHPWFQTERHVKSISRQVAWSESEEEKNFSCERRGTSILE
jgi:hypothetical protein